MTTTTAPVNGTAVPLPRDTPAYPLVPELAGPVSPWPRQDSTAPVAGETPARLSRWRAPDGDTVITWAMAATVAVVAVDAAIVSYSHIYALATGQQGTGTETGIQPALLPLSIDGIIAEASLVLLYAARHKLRAPRLATFMLWLGIVATVAANVAHGLPSSMLPPVAHVAISALLSAWPAGAFIGSVEMLMGLIRATRSATAADSSGDTEDDKKDDGDGDTDGGKPKQPPPPKGRAPRDTVTDTIKRHPDWDNDKIAAHCGVSKRTVERRRKTGATA